MAFDIIGGISAEKNKKTCLAAVPTMAHSNLGLSKKHGFLLLLTRKMLFLRVENAIMLTSIKLSKITKIDLRDCWKNEATNFTPWLASEENIALLADATSSVKHDWRRLDGKKASSIEYSQSINVFDTSKQEDIYAWYREYTEKFVSFFKPIIKKL